jgi:hypothetical protein
MVFFLPLSLYIAIKNPVSDCGCFGDALIISNWETFLKNLVLTAMAIWVFIARSTFKNKYNIHFQNGYFIFFLVIFSLTINHSFNHLPIIDFRPYKIGNNIPEKMSIPEGAPTDQYQYTFVYKENASGKNKKFDETNYPWSDSVNWTFVEMVPKLVKKGYSPAIHDFTIENQFGEDVADFYLHEPVPTFMLVAYNLEKTNTRKQKKINEFAAQALDKGYHFFCLTSSNIETIEKFKQEYDARYNFYQCDEITLKTIIRSNPGLVLLNSGTVMNKWHWRDFPDFEKAQAKKRFFKKTQKKQIEQLDSIP